MAMRAVGRMRAGGERTAAVAGAVAVRMCVHVSARAATVLLSRVRERVWRLVQRAGAGGARMEAVRLAVRRLWLRTSVQWMVQATARTNRHHAAPLDGDGCELGGFSPQSVT
jgi:ABC-type uncharacterized transport system YnjBCD permease subunit